MTTASRVIQFGPMIGLVWPDNARMWVQRLDVVTLRRHLLPAKCPHPDLPGFCWVWTGPLASDGRPMLLSDGNAVSVRRLLYDIEFGPLSVRDYLAPICRVGRCCNPRHQATEARGPVQGKVTYADAPSYDRCRYGHPLTPDNVYLYQGRKLCRVCRAAAEKRHRERVVRAERGGGGGGRTRRAGVGKVARRA